MNPSPFWICGLVVELADGRVVLREQLPGDTAFVVAFAAVDGILAVVDIVFDSLISMASLIGGEARGKCVLSKVSKSGGEGRIGPDWEDYGIIYIPKDASLRKVIWADRSSVQESSMAVPKQSYKFIN